MVQKTKGQAKSDRAQTQQMRLVAQVVTRVFPTISVNIQTASGCLATLLERASLYAQAVPTKHSLTRPVFHFAQPRTMRR